MASCLRLARLKSSVGIAPVGVSLRQLKVDLSLPEKPIRKRKCQFKRIRKPTGEDGVNFYMLQHKTAHPAIEPSVFYDGVLTYVLSACYFTVAFLANC